MSELTLTIGDRVGAVSAVLDLPESARWLTVLAHGAGAGMRHPFLQDLTERLVQRKMGVLRYQFPYMEAGRKRPDAPRILTATVRAAVTAGAEEAEAAGGLPLFAGGKSLGGRMTSTAAAEGGLEALKGIVFLGFPLHPPKKPGDQRAAHLFQVETPMLFVQGTRDELADLSLLSPIVEDLGKRRAEMHVVEGGDHSFKVLKRSGRKPDEVMDEIADAVVAFARARS